MKLNDIRAFIYKYLMQNIQHENHYLFPEGVTNILLQDNENYLLSSSDCLFSLHSSITKKQLLTKINFKNKCKEIEDRLDFLKDNSTKDSDGIVGVYNIEKIGNQLQIHVMHTMLMYIGWQ